MAVVSRAVMAGPRGFTRTVVIKRILAELAGRSNFVEMLAEEARLSARLCHQNIVQIYDFGQIEGEYFLAMEYVDGIDLFALLRRCALRGQSLPLASACHLVAEVAAGLAYAHALTDDKGRPLEIVHRDVSPQNIMLSRQGEVKLLDFGIAKSAAFAREAVTQLGVLKGKMGYLSPEQAHALPVDRRSDIFTLGIVFHECLTMRRLFHGASRAETVQQIRKANVVAPSALRSDVPPELDALVLKMMARDPAERFASCEELLAALAPLQRALAADGRTLGALVRELAPYRRHTERSNVTEPAALPLMPLLLGTRTYLIPRSAPRRWTVAAAAVGVLLMILMLVPRGHSAGGAARPRALVSSNSAARLRDALAELPMPEIAMPAPPPVERVHLSLSGARGAEVLIDGKLMGIMPVELTLPRASGERRLRVRAEGARTWTRRIAADVDLALEVRLAPLPVTSSTDDVRPPANDLLRDLFESQHR
jgi:tRNA A-37 threonylcarbamoyl transferase component Bud32